jgi:8-amino-7-oxononanoate synthase
MRGMADVRMNGPIEKTEPSNASPGRLASPGNSILARVGTFSDSFDRLASDRIVPFNLEIEKFLSPVEAIVSGKRVLLFGTNGYLGMNFRPECMHAAEQAIRRHGVGSTASRVAGGNQTIHLKLEAEIAALYGRQDAIVFSTGFMANLGVISTLVREGDAIFIDAHCHASIFDGCRLSGARVAQFRHNDADDLARLFRESAVPGPNTLVIVEGVYSVLGDVGDLTAITAVTKKNGAVLIVDEAHAMGMYGKNGRGIAELQGLEDDVDVIVGTFSKSAGGIGGYAVTNNPAMRRLRFMARSYLFTASLPPPIVEAMSEAVRIIATDQGPREKLWTNVKKLHAGLDEIGLKTCAAPGPVGSIRMPGAFGGYEFWKNALDRGIYVNLLMPPATPEGEVLLRFSVSAAHSDEHIESALSVFRALASQAGFAAPSR